MPSALVESGFLFRGCLLASLAHTNLLYRALKPVCFVYDNLMWLPLPPASCGQSSRVSRLMTAKAVSQPPVFFALELVTLPFHGPRFVKRPAAAFILALLGDLRYGVRSGFPNARDNIWSDLFALSYVIDMSTIFSGVFTQSNPDSTRPRKRSIDLPRGEMTQASR